MEKQQPPRQRHVVLVPFPFPGHTNPMLQLATALHSKGFANITIAHSQFNFPDPSNHDPHFTFLKLSDGISREDHSQGFLPFVRNLNEKIVTPLHELLSRMIQEDLDEIPCIIYDGFMYLAMAHGLKLPSLVMRTSSAADFLMYFSLLTLQQEGLIPLPDSKLLDDLVPGLEPFRFKDIEVLKSPNLDSWLQILATIRNLGSSSAMIFNTINLLENSSLTKLRKICQVPVFALGPLHKIAPTSSSSTGSLLKPDMSCINWLDKQASGSVLYISMGSAGSMNPTDLTEMAWGLANSGQPFLWVIRPGSVEGSEWIELLPEGFNETVGERGCVIKWAPQNAVLTHDAVGGFWSHCGWNSTLESLSEGVPMICRPMRGDQMMNTRLLTYVWKVGFKLENELERVEIDKCIKRLMVDEEGKEIRQRAMDLKKNISLSIEKGGSSYNSLNELIELIQSF